MTEFTVADTLKAHIRAIEVPREPDGLWHPSSIFSCDRQALYEIRGVPPSDERDDRSRGILRQGTRLHELVQDAMTKESGARAVYHEVEVSVPFLGVYGHCDTLLEFSDDEYELLEFKSASPNKMKYGSLPSEEHVKQAKTYAVGLMQVGGVLRSPTIAGDDVEELVIPRLGNKLRRVRIAYFDRNDLTVQEFTLFPSPEWEPELIDQITKLERHKNAGTLPLRLPPDAKGKKHWLCASYCQFRTRCYGTDGEGVE